MAHLDELWLRESGSSQTTRGGHGMPVWRAEPWITLPSSVAPLRSTPKTQDSW